jgi:ADP-ribose pyrophosphatase YjhB (NUDIX family)
MNYCSECGGKITLKWVEHEKRHRHSCTSCGRTHYQNPSVIVCCLIHRQGKLLMCRRAEYPARGQWTVPSGFLERGETLEEGAVRETFEETGVILDPVQLDLCSVINMHELNQIAVAFRAQLTVEPQITPGLECLEVAFVAEEEIPRDKFAWYAAMGTWPRQIFKEITSQDFTIQMITIGSPEGTGFRSREYPIGTGSTVGCVEARQPVARS